PDVFAGRESVQIAATSGTAQGRATLPLLAGPAAAAKATLQQSLLRAGDPPVEGTVLLQDAFGNPVRGAAVALSSTIGRAQVVKEVGRGAYQVRFQASEDGPTGAGRLLARAGGGPELPAGDVVVLPVAADFGLSLGVRAGAQSNLALLHGGGGLAELAVRPVGRWPLELLVEAGGEALIQVVQPFAEAGPDATIATDLRWATGALGARVSFPLGAALCAYGALSGGAQYTWAHYQVGGVGGPAASRDDSGLSAFARASAGVSYRAGPGRLLGELQGTYAPAPGSTAVGGNLGQVTAMVGYLLEVR
ncbi:MAG TPA: hypothetical protein VFU23_02855, partial [Gemmatimonadales bacterium]|nr:hypothetical protein [Gemmatimonadales bacterium]